MEVSNLGLIDYSEALKLQEEAVSAVRASRSAERILVCEHPEVITVGRGLESRAEVFTDKVPIFEVARGGRATLHLPGQVVVYPIIDLKKRGKDLHAYMHALEAAVIETLADFRIRGHAVKGKTGVWVLSRRNQSEKKIASIGIAVKDWISYHGLALNVTCDLARFKNLNPCGFSADVMTSVQDELSPEYKEVWELTSQKLFHDVSLRLIENLLPRIEADVLAVEAGELAFQDTEPFT